MNKVYKIDIRNYLSMQRTKIQQTKIEYKIKVLELKNNTYIGNLKL
jgi:hypothetical protein